MYTHRIMKLLWTAFFFTALPALAGNPLSGTWKVNFSKSTFSQKPQKYEIANGTYKCLTCDPPAVVKADGADQPDSGHPAYDTMSLRIIDPKNIEIVNKKAGKLVAEVKITISDDNAVAT
jgi:hypothetical protein